MAGEDRDRFDLDAYHYELPEGLIAQAPTPRREECRLMVWDRTRREAAHRMFSDLPHYLGPGDVLVVNDSKVVRARLLGTRESGGRVELFVLEPFGISGLGNGAAHECLFKAAKPLRENTLIRLKTGLLARVVAPPRDGRVLVSFLTSLSMEEMLEAAGEVPLPPYIKRVTADPADVENYQTVYARNPGSVAAPTAGLHFTEALLGDLEHQGVEVVRLTLHVGYGTFAPVRSGDIRSHRMHGEFAELSDHSARRIALAKSEGRRVIAVGTTSVRVLEWVVGRFGCIRPFSGTCNAYIYPGFRFRVVDALITNFHLPRSSLLLLVAAFAGRKAILEAYGQAVERGYRFFSYGDAMLIV